MARSPRSSRPPSRGSRRPLTALPPDYDESGQAYLALQPGEDPSAYAPQAQVVTIDGQRYALLSGEQAMPRADAMKNRMMRILILEK